MMRFKIFSNLFVTFLLRPTYKGFKTKMEQTMKFQFTLIFSLLLSVNLAFAGKMRLYEVSITNVTKGQTFTPRLVATHEKSLSFFTLGQPASSDLEMLAEGGDTSSLEAYLDEEGKALTDGGLLEPGETTTFEISGYNKHHLSFAAMLLPTNDTFVALSAVKLPEKDSVSYVALAYDAGTEKNDQDCANIPGPGATPFCNGNGYLEDKTDAEGFVYISNGIHDLGDLVPELHDWNNAVAVITIKKIKN